MDVAERVDAARLTGSALAGVSGVVRDAHGSIATQVFSQVRKYVGPAVTPVEFTHDAIAHGVYATTGLVLRGAGILAGRFVESRAAGPGHAAQVLAGVDNPGAPIPMAGPTRNLRIEGLRAVVQGFHGDKMVASGSALAYPMTLRRSGSDVPITARGLASAYPDASGQLVVFVHGFVGTEQVWKRRADRDPLGRRLSYGRRLEADGEFSALWVRYNTGQRVSRNGRDLRDLLRRVHARWPVPVRRIVLVGHSMGGLVCHSALAQADLDEPWTEVTTDTVTLGTPHHGTPLERAANTAAAELGSHELTRWIADIIRYRSDGIRDMRHGNLVPEDWLDHDPEDPLDRRTHARPHEHVRHLAVVATVPRDPDGLLAGVLGDLVVGRDSARGWSADPAEGAVGASRTVVLGGMNHLDLLNHHRVYALMRPILLGSDEAPAAARA
ncbi:esterase/lipase family protein [Janibacter sp. GXQ6167]|uniref:esterase/lipase family protein n=1 Tax=Janibacter sp. GXQ6167 TaxID=3240791 RepID=UPI003525A123